MEVHVWELPLSVSETSIAEYSRLLSPDEHSRAARFHFEKDARKFSVTRACVRLILGAYMSSQAHELKFAYAKHGKPSLAGSNRDIRFSISHSGELALLAVAQGCEVGVDVEAIRENVETDKLAERFFSVPERTSLRELQSRQRVHAFFRCWTCKEAFLKGQGFGLSRSLSSFDVEVNPELPARLVATRPDDAEAQRWFLHDVATAPNYAAAVAVESAVSTLKILRWKRV